MPLGKLLVLISSVLQHLQEHLRQAPQPPEPLQTQPMREQRRAPEQRQEPEPEQVLELPLFYHKQPGQPQRSKRS